LLHVAASSAADPEVRIVRLGVDVSHASNPELVSKAIALLRACTINSTAYAASPGAWTEALAADSLVQVRFSTPLELDMDGEHFEIDEFLLPLPADHWPEHFFARRGEVVLSFTFYLPEALRDLSWAPPLALDTESPYSGLVKLREK
jgi:hypothetical protein